MISKPYYLMVTFWGKRFTDDFYSLCLSSLLSPNNLPALAGIPGCKFIFATSKDDWAALQSRPLFEQLRQFMEPVFIDIGCPLKGEPQILHMSKGHRLAARRTSEDGAWGGFVSPDLIVSDGMVRLVLEHARMGKKAVLAPALRYAMEPVVSALAQQGLLRPDQPMCLEPRKLAAVAHRSLHSEIRKYEFDAPYFGDYPIWSYWSVPGRNGIVLHTVSWALLLGDFGKIHGRDDSVLEQDTIDGHYIDQNFYRVEHRDDLYLVSDSDEVLFMGLTSESELTYLPFRDQPINNTAGGERDRLHNIRKFLKSPECDEFRRWAYHVPFQIHGDELAPESLETARKSGTKIAHALDMGPMDRIAQRIFAYGFRHGFYTPERYPQSNFKLYFDGAQFAARKFTKRILSASLRVIFGRAIGPVLGRLNRRQLRQTMKLVPRAYLRPVLRRVHSGRSRATST